MTLLLAEVPECEFQLWLLLMQTLGGEGMAQTTGFVPATHGEESDSVPGPRPLQALTSESVIGIPRS